MNVDLRPQRTRATLLGVAGVSLTAFAGWGWFRPDLFEARALPILAAVTGLFFLAVFVALLRAPRGLDAFAFDEGRVVMTEEGERTAFGVGIAERVIMMREPLGRGHPVLCLLTREGSLLEVTPLRYGYVEPVSAAIREALDEAPNDVPAIPDGLDVRLSEDSLLVGDRSISISSLHAVDFVADASVHGPGLVLHTAPPEPFPDDDVIEAAVVMRRIAAGEHVPLADVSRGRAVALALHIDRARSMMQA